ncbi:MAG: hypothetical protein V1856_02430 [Candidatus Liptonbacteria bacterium]
MSEKPSFRIPSRKKVREVLEGLEVMILIGEYELVSWNDDANIIVIRPQGTSSARWSLVEVRREGSLYLETETSKWWWEGMALLSYYGPLTRQVRKIYLELERRALRPHQMALSAGAI